VKPKLGIPDWILPQAFDAARDVPQYDFAPNNEDLLLTTVRKKALTKEALTEVKRLDRLFDAVVISLMVTYVLLVYMWVSGYVPWWVAVPAFTALRTSFAGGGHYFVHRKRPCLGDYFFDLNYVGSCIAIDGHVLVHHSYTQSEADSKRGFFGGMMGIPRLLRIPVHTVFQLGHQLTGMLLRGWSLAIESPDMTHLGLWQIVRQLRPNSMPFSWGFWAVQLWLRFEMVLALWGGVGWAWLFQFCTTVWWNTFLIVASHDFETVLEKDSKDWARFQLLNSHDLSIVGNRWIDCFLSAGLSPHRAHHIFPYQRSGFSNIYSSMHLAAAAKEHGLPWEKPKNFFTEIVPFIFRMYVWAPVSDPVTRKSRHKSFLAEHLDPSCYKYIVDYIVAGFLGDGSI